MLYRVAQATYVSTWCILTFIRDIMTSQRYFVKHDHVVLTEHAYNPSCLLVSFNLWSLSVIVLYTVIAALSTFYHHIFRARHHRFLGKINHTHAPSHTHTHTHTHTNTHTYIYDIILKFTAIYIFDIALYTPIQRVYQYILLITST